MRRFLTLVSLLCLALPAGITLTGCTRNPGANYCNGLGYGPKITDVSKITLQPATTGISMAWGQTRQLASPQAATCKGTTASVSTYIYGTTNNQLVDVSPTGSVCAGTWNRNTGGGISDYTICSAPSPLPSTGGLPYSTAYVTATANAVTSNPVEVYVHALVTSLSLVGPTTCYSQGQQWPSALDVQACYSATNPKTGAKQQFLLCAPSSVTSSGTTAPVCPLPYTTGSDGKPVQVALSSIPACLSAIGTLSYAVDNTNVATINNETNMITANLPGTTAITATVANAGSSAGYFSTCPPRSISVAMADGNPYGTITQGVTQNLVTKVVDTQGATITGLTLDYQSTDPVDISAGSSGALTASYPGQASVYAVCQPSTCNPAPINMIGSQGTGLPVSSNAVTVTVPGTASQYVWYAAPGASQYFVPVEMLTGTVGSTVRLPYVPNSMKMDQFGTNLYFGSSHELMVYSTAGNSLSRESTATPGVVLAVAPNGSQVLVNDQVRKVFYLVASTGTSSVSYGGIGYAAEWTPDAKTLYVVGQDATTSDPALFVYNANTGWTESDLKNELGATSVAGATTVANNLSLLVPGIGVYLSGVDKVNHTVTNTVAHTWCPTGKVGDYNSMVFYPLVDTVPVESDALATTAVAQASGKVSDHILGATLASGTLTLNDIDLSQDMETYVAKGGACPAAVKNVLQPLPLTHGDPTKATWTGVSATAINQIVASTNSSLAFITYQGVTPNAPLPYYQPSLTAGNPGVSGQVTLNGSSAVTAPVAGAFSPDNKLFFLSTAGDNQIHYIDVTGTVPVDTKTAIEPKLPSCVPVDQGGKDPGCNYTGTDSVVPATVIEVKPRTTT